MPYTLAVLEYLRYKTLADLTAQYAIEVRRGVQQPHLAQLKYSQIDSPMGERIVQECRGLILDTRRTDLGDQAVVSFPYTKFFNLGEGHAAKIDWPTAKVWEKADGSLMQLFYHDGEWRVASSGVPDAGGQVNGNDGMTFRDLFWQAWAAEGYAITALNGFERFCFMLELCAPENRIVVPHKERTLRLHGCRNLETFKEHDPVEFAHIFNLVQRYDVDRDPDKIAALAAVPDGIASEGYVVCDALFNRVKVKNPKYVALAHMKDSWGPRRMLEIARSGESSEWLAYFPEMEVEYKALEERVHELLTGAQRVYDRLKPAAATQKDFALAVKAEAPTLAAVLFALYHGHARTPAEYLAKCTMQAAERLMEQAAP